MFRILRIIALTIQMIFRSTEYKIALAHSTKDPTVLTVLAEDYGDSGTDDRIQIAVAENSHTPPVVLTKLAHDSALTVKSVVFSNLSTPMATRVLLVSRLSPGQKEDMVTIGEDHIPSEILAVLADEPDAFIRFCVGKNKNTPPDILRKLSEDKDARRGVAYNPATPPKLLETLIDRAFQESDEDLASALLENSNLPKHIRSRFLNFPDSHIQWITRNWFLRQQEQRSGTVPS